MWCPSCKADVAAEVAADNRRVRCATCGAEISASPSNPVPAKTREARDLLERWAHERRGESPSSQASAGAQGSRSGPERAHGGGVRLDQDVAPDTDEAAAVSKSSRRVDSTHSLSALAATQGARSQTSTNEIAANAAALPGPRTLHAQHQPQVRRPSSRVHSQHDYPAASPHFEIQSSLLEFERKRTNWSAVTGQLLAYAGVGLLTVGSTLVLWSYFGGPAGYGPTGWLTSTAGQMLLFLGVVTLVSGGMEQTSEEVKSRIDRLGERIIRIEQISRENALRGPNFPLENYSSAASPQTVDEIVGQSTDMRR
jgi:hypothetical protein